MTFETFQFCSLLNVSNYELSIPALKKDYGGGFESSVLVGKPHGLRRWNLSGELITDLAEQSVGEKTVFQYLWDFFRYHVTNGNKPFYIVNPNNQRKYLVSFIDSILSFEVFTAKLFASEITLKQRKVENMYFEADEGSVFDPLIGNVKPVLYLDADTISGSNGTAVASWTDATGKVFNSASSQPTLQTKNGKKVVRFNASNTPLDLTSAINFKQVFFLLSYDADNFDDYRGILSGVSSGDVLAGGVGTDTFFNFGLSGYEYKKNGTVLANINQQIAGGNKLFVVSIKYPNGFNLSDLRIGQQRGLTARKWRGDLRKIVAYQDTLTSDFELRVQNWLMYERDI
jgi:hypothetical protein